MRNSRRSVIIFTCLAVLLHTAGSLWAGDGAELIAAANNGNVKKVKALLDKGVDANSKDEHRWTPLHFAANEEVAKLLVGSGADVKAKDNDGRTPLHAAKSRQVAELLLAKGAELDAKENKYGTTPLTAAMYRGMGAMSSNNEDPNKLHAKYLKMAELSFFFVERGADVNVKDKNGGTLLHAATGWRRIRKGKKDIAELLIEKGADVNAKNGEGDAPLHVAVNFSSFDLIPILIKNGADVNAQGKNGDTPLFRVLKLLFRGVGVMCHDSHNAQQTILAISKLLVENGADVTAKHRDGSEPLDWAAFHVDEATANYLMEKGATPGFCAAVALGRKERVAELLQKGTDPNQAKWQEKSAIYWAGQRGHRDIVQLLKSKGAEFTDNEEGRTPLHDAAEKGDKAAIERLITEGANVNASNRGVTALHIAAEKGHREIAELLIDKAADVNARIVRNSETVLIVAAREGQWKIVKLLLDRGANVNEKDACDRTPLHKAVSYHHKKVVELLIASGGDVNARNSSGRTPLHMAAWENQEEIIILLIRNGADVDAKSEFNDTPLDMTRRENIKALLREHGGERERTGPGGKAPAWEP